MTATGPRRCTVDGALRGSATSHPVDYARRGREGVLMTDEELIVEFALTRLDNPGLDLEEIAALVVRRVGPDHMLEFASQNLGTRGELRGAVFPSAVEHVLRVVLTLRGPAD